jgi:hypothetical protein
MIVTNDSAITRLKSPMNLMNRLHSLSSKKNDAMSLFGINKSQAQTSKTNEPLPPAKIEFNPFSEKKTETLTAPSVHPKETSQPILDNILEDNDTQIKLGLAHDNALKLLNDSVTLLATKLDDIKADKLPSVVSAASKVVEGIRKERSESAKLGKDKEVHYHFYTPQQRKVSDYEIIEVG